MFTFSWVGKRKVFLPFYFLFLQFLLLPFQVFFMIRWAEWKAHTITNWRRIKLVITATNNAIFTIHNIFNIFSETLFLFCSRSSQSRWTKSPISCYFPIRSHTRRIWNRLFIQIFFISFRAFECAFWSNFLGFVLFLFRVFCPHFV